MHFFRGAPRKGFTYSLPNALLISEGLTPSEVANKKEGNIPFKGISSLAEKNLHYIF